MKGWKSVLHRFPQDGNLLSEHFSRCGTQVYLNCRWDDGCCDETGAVTGPRGGRCLTMLYCDCSIQIEHAILSYLRQNGPESLVYLKTSTHMSCMLICIFAWIFDFICISKNVRSKLPVHEALLQETHADLFIPSSTQPWQLQISHLAAWILNFCTVIWNDLNACE